MLARHPASQVREPDHDASASCLVAARPAPLHFAVLRRSRTSQHFHVLALATMLLAHVSAFAGVLRTHAFARHRRARDVTLTRLTGSRAQRPRLRCDVLSQVPYTGATDTINATEA
jgi:hypothetical protein